MFCNPNYNDKFNFGAGNGVIMKKKVGKRCRTKNQIRSAKAKGSALEYDVQHSLMPLYWDIYRTAERGYQMQIDLVSDQYNIAIECKRLKGISWNQAKKYYEKLCEVAPKGYICYLIFKSNRQPCLVMLYNTHYEEMQIIEFFDAFGTPLEKHPSTRVKKE